MADQSKEAPSHRARRAGFAKGTFTYIAPDFDAPLEDFAETCQPRLTGPIIFVRILLHTWRLGQTDAIPLLGLEESDSSYAEDLLSVVLRYAAVTSRIGSHTCFVSERPFRRCFETKKSRMSGCESRMQR